MEGEVFICVAAIFYYALLVYITSGLDGGTEILPFIVAFLVLFAMSKFHCKIKASCFFACIPACGRVCGNAPPPVRPVFG